MVLQAALQRLVGFQLIVWFPWAWGLEGFKRVPSTWLIKVFIRLLCSIVFVKWQEQELLLKVLEELLGPLRCFGVMFL